MNNTISIFKREIGSYFSTPVAYVFIVIFLFLSGLFTFSVSGFYEAGQASLSPFFQWHPWLYLFLIPAVAMRLWSEERKSGTIELLFTMPVSPTEAILGKFLAAWVFVGIALALTVLTPITACYLGNPDLGVAVSGYLGSFLMAGAYLAIGTCMSALTKNQVVSFILSVVVCLFFLLAGFPTVLDYFSSWAPGWLTDAVAGMSFLTHFNLITQGVIVLPDLVFFLSMIIGWLCACAVILEMKKAE
jgi:ABC-2 type transport system permease protein